MGAVCVRLGTNWERPGVYTALDPESRVTLSICPEKRDETRIDANPCAKAWTPALGSLQNNGGPTNTHAVLAGSLLIDAGDPSGRKDQINVNLITDQRDLLRPTDGNGAEGAQCEIGAFEVGAVGIGSVAPNKGSSEAKDQIIFDLVWDSPTRWRDLTALELLQRMGWSSQKPQRQPLHRDDQAIRHWKRYIWPRIKKVA